MAAAAHKPLAAITADDLAAAGAAEPAALHSAVRSALGAASARGPAAVWGELSRGVLRPGVPFAVHRMLYYGCYAGSPSSTPPAWTPDPEEASLTNVGRVLEARGSEIIGEAYKDPVTSFRDFHKFSNENPEAYWKMIFEEMGITFSVEPSCILRDSDAFPGGEWLPGAVLNAAANCLTAKPGRTSSDVAIVWRDEGKDSEPLNFVTVEELRKKVCLVANALDALNLAKGSAIAFRANSSSYISVVGSARTYSYSGTCSMCTTAYTSLQFCSTGREHLQHKERPLCSTALIKEYVLTLGGYCYISHFLR